MLTRRLSLIALNKTKKDRLHIKNFFNFIEHRRGHVSCWVSCLLSFRHPAFCLYFNWGVRKKIVFLKYVFYLSQNICATSCLLFCLPFCSRFIVFFLFVFLLIVSPRSVWSHYLLKLISPCLYIACFSYCFVSCACNDCLFANPFSYRLPLPAFSCSRTLQNNWPAKMDLAGAYLIFLRQDKHSLEEHTCKFLDPVYYNEVC